MGDLPRAVLVAHLDQLLLGVRVPVLLGDDLANLVRGKLAMIANGA
jgi:hypothetical protein